MRSPKVRAGRGAVGMPLLAAVLLAASLVLPYWQLTLYAPQYPGGLRVFVHLTHVAGDAQEVTTLNHYIGMKPLEEAAPVERAVAVPVVLVFGALAVLSGTLRGPWRWLLRLPLVLFPLGFFADLAAWLWYYGHSMDPAAPIRLEPFMPAILGRGVIAQFRTVASFHVGFYLALAASLVALYDLWRKRVQQERVPVRIGGPAEVAAR
ncbi:MAG: cytochrome C [Armatimonadota bacterium]|nr:cytochrome C [Armatimonadota bacterium]MDR7430160.1 cytochrome C [Armatimonadota bacterium]MDR7431369.1 cytochrome C [Armatimonadota bacterium]MDR7446396.1 cytochrome C [Armatimonadota bacterium]MDR7462081.1 cytochrome C [Armatimonadota bacterium]